MAGKALAPIATFFILGDEPLPSWWHKIGDRQENGGLICENITFLGQSGVRNVRGLNIAFLSGAYNKQSKANGRSKFSKPQIERLMQAVRETKAGANGTEAQHVDMLLTSDWPRGVHLHCPPAALAPLQEHFSVATIG